MHTYRYGTLMRPPGPFSVPREGMILAMEWYFENRNTGHFCGGIVECDRPLTEKEIADYELEQITDYE